MGTNSEKRNLLSLKYFIVYLELALEYCYESNCASDELFSHQKETFFYTCVKYFGNLSVFLF